MIIVLGVAGSGKSTQSRLLADRDGMVWLSMGELLRRVITDERKDLMLAGKVLDEHETIDILDAELKRLGDDPEIILDGFPRGLTQAQWLLRQHTDGRFAIHAVIHLQAHQGAVKQRLLARGRMDDTEDAIKERFEEYEHTIKPIIAMMQSNGVPIIEVNAEQQPDTVQTELIEKMAALGMAV